MTSTTVTASMMGDTVVTNSYVAGISATATVVPTIQRIIAMYTDTGLCSGMKLRYFEN